MCPFAWLSFLVVSRFRCLHVLNGCVVSPLTCILPAPLRPYPGGARDNRPEEASSWSGGLSASWPPLTQWGLLTRPCCRVWGAAAFLCRVWMGWSGQGLKAFLFKLPLSGLWVAGSCWFSWVTVGAQALDGSQGPAPPPVCRSSLSVFSHGCQAWSPGSQWNSAGGVGRCTPLFWEPKSTLVFLLNGRLVCLSGEACFPLLLCLPTSGLVLVPEPWSGQPRTAPRAPACPWTRTWGHRC